MKVYALLGHENATIFTTKAKLETWLTRCHVYSKHGSGPLFSRAHREYEDAPGSMEEVCAEGLANVLNVNLPSRWGAEDKIYEINFSKHRLEVYDK